MHLGTFHTVENNCSEIFGVGNELSNEVPNSTGLDAIGLV